MLLNILEDIVGQITIKFSNLLWKKICINICVVLFFNTKLCALKTY